MGRLISGALDLYCGCLALILLLVTLRKSLRSSVSKKSRIMLLTACIMLLCYGSAICFFSETKLLHPILSVCSIICFYLIMALYTRYLADILSAEQHRSTLVVFRVNAFVCAIGACYWCADYIYPFFYDVRNHHLLQPALYVVSILPGIVSVLLDLLLILLSKKETALQDRLLLMAFPLLPFVSFLVNWLIPGLSLQQSMIFASLLMNHFYFDAKKDRELEHQKKELQVLRLKNTLERVKPHFIYNVLTSIYYLCAKDSMLAQKAIEAFSSFLREALQHAEHLVQVPFERELSLIKNYVKLESLRFENQFTVFYKIDETSFFVPPFSVQPLVENAIKYGMRRMQNGKIFVAVKEVDSEYLVTVTDNGVGFDAEQLHNDKNPSGIRNVQEMLKLTGSGYLEVFSTPGNGTHAVMHVYKSH